jgi:glycosyltransferase involved in cell wall biosynthesis
LATPFLSLIIPARNEEARLPTTLEQVLSFVASRSYPVEVLVVENGSQDRTLQIAQDFAARFPTLQVRKARPTRARPSSTACWRRRAGTALCATPIFHAGRAISRFLPPGERL